MNKASKIQYKKSSKILCLTFHNIEYQLSAEFLRVHSPSAEVRGHGNQGEVLQVEKKNVAILAIEAAGNYALKLTFDDQHDSGLYTWDYLYDLAIKQDYYWQVYLDKLEDSGQQRENKVFFKSV